MGRAAKFAACFSVVFLWAHSGLCQTPSSQTAQDFVSGIYRLVGSDGGNLPDWDKVRACFAREAVIVLRTSRTAVTTFSVDGFIRDFVDFYERPLKIGERTIVPKETGFRESVVRLSAWEYGDMAHVLVLYEARITVDGARTQQGVDSWQLSRKDGRWLVTAVTNEAVRPGLTLPATLQDSDAALQSPEAVEQRVRVAEEEHFEALYAAARRHAGLNHREPAYRYLARAMGAGFYDRSRLLQDEAFNAFRDDELFRTLARRAWANGYVMLLERSNREDVQKSPQIMEVLAFRPGERVADIGAGSGYFTIPVARAVGPAGVVHALDIAPEMLEYLEFRIRAQKLDNIRLRRVTSEDPQLEPGNLDTILMIDTIHYVKDRVAYTKKLRQGLAAGGRLVIIDYIPKPMSERPWGPPPEQQISRGQMDADMAAAGFKVERAYEFLPEQYFVIYKP
jgi:ubiquinone/menaquinone biosynthesis C-methylase UbiE